jgi:hypothetical protein
MADILRRVQGDAVAAFGLGSSECPHRIVASGPYWRLRDYGRHEAPQSLLIVAAPIKRPYIWDLAPSASAIGYCLQKGLHVHLLKWVPASRRASNTGLDECAHPIASRRCGLEARWVTSQARQADVVPSLHMVIGRRLDQSGFLLLAKATRKHISMYRLRLKRLHGYGRHDPPAETVFSRPRSSRRAAR